MWVSCEQEIIGLKIIKKNKIKKVIEISDEIADGKEILLEIPQNICIYYGTFGKTYRMWRNLVMESLMKYLSE